MSTQSKILAFAGSTREASVNRRLVEIAAKAAKEAGAAVKVIDLGDYPLPLYDADLEAKKGLPAEAMALKSLFNDHDGLLIASPEYNGGISGVLKNGIDWVSRKAPGEQPLAAYKNKVAGILAGSPGQIGGTRGLIQLRQVLSHMGVLVLAKQAAIGGANSAFNEAGELEDDAKREMARGVGVHLAETLAALRR